MLDSGGHLPRIETGHILVPVDQWQRMSQPGKDRYTLVRTISGRFMYVRDTPEAIATAKKVHGIMDDFEWQTRQDPLHKFFVEEVMRYQEIISEKLDGVVFGDEVVTFIFETDIDEDEDWLISVFVTAFRELDIPGDPDFQHEIGNFWTCFVVP